MDRVTAKTLISALACALFLAAALVKPCTLSRVLKLYSRLRRRRRRRNRILPSLSKSLP